MGKYENDKFKVFGLCRESNDLYFYVNILKIIDL